MRADSATWKCYQLMALIWMRRPIGLELRRELLIL